MTETSIELSIIIPAFIAGGLVLATHVPLGRQVLRRGIIFIDLAIAQIAAGGVIVAHLMGWDDSAGMRQLSAFAAALLGALLLTWTERRWPDVQEAMIGAIFILAATAGILLLAYDPHGGEHLQDMLVGQILWVSYEQLFLAASISVAVLLMYRYFVPLASTLGFYVVFACAVTVSVQLVGVYLVFASLIIPALATRHYSGTWQLVMAYGVGLVAYAIGLLLSAIWDLPAGAVIVWSLGSLGMAVYGFCAFSRHKGREAANEKERLSGAGTVQK
jgi:zinc/manganese transport system permease protein